MKNGSRKQLKFPVSLTSRLSVMAALIAAWLITVKIRKAQIGLHCFKNPALCDASTLPAWERISVGRWDPTLNFWSFVTQDASAILCLLIPICLGIFVKGASNQREKISRIGRAFGDQVILLLSASALNGFANEICRMIVQRPRPFVYQDPAAFGRVEAHYTSFYSGHTSFSALSCTLLYMMVRKHHPTLSRTHPWAWRGILAVVVLLPVATGILRVAAGRHFPSDVLVGAMAGFLWAWLSVRTLSA